MMLSECPDLLTVEEAAQILRIGRSRAYELTQRWRETDGNEGIAVIQLGRQLRVPKAWLEKQLSIVEAA
jgi:excisionase family DNA binding protein